MTFEEQHEKNEIIVKHIKAYRTIKTWFESRESATMDNEAALIIALDDVAEEMLPICKQRIKILNREKAPRKAKQKKSIIKQEPTTPPIEANK